MPSLERGTPSIVGVLTSAAWKAERVLDRLSIFAVPIARLLEPEEVAHSLTPVTYFAGVEELGDEPPKFDGDTVIDMVLGSGSPYWMRVANSMVTGTSLVGWPGSMAVVVRDTARDPTDDLLLTDRRLLIVHQEPNDTFAQRWAAPLSDIVAVRCIPRVFQAGRIWLSLADGSAVALCMGLVRKGPAARFCEDLTGLLR